MAQPVTPAYLPEVWGDRCTVTVLEQFECRIVSIAKGVVKTQNRQIYPEVRLKEYAGHMGLEMFSRSERWAIVLGNVFYYTHFRVTSWTGEVRRCDELKLKEQ